MKLATFEVKTHLGKHRRLGAVTSAGIVDLNFACAARLGGNYRLADALVPADMLEFLRGGPQSMAAARDSLTDPLPPLGARDETIVYRPEQIRLLAPLPNPASVRDFYAFEDHVKKGFEKRGEPMPAEWYEIPVYYKSAHHNIIGTEADAPWPSFTDKFDYELELAAVIGKQGSNILAENASEYIAGYTVMNDFSARDIQRKEMKVRLGPAKGKDWCTALGPYLVTSEEIGDVYRLEMLARVNGEEWSRGNSCSIYWKFEQMIEFITRDDTIYPGDVLGSGTVGSGCGLELDRWVKRGDVIELEIEKLGVLRNRVT